MNGADILRVHDVKKRAESSQTCSCNYGIMMPDLGWQDIANILKDILDI